LVTFLKGVFGFEEESEKRHVRKRVKREKNMRNIVDFTYYFYERRTREIS